MAETHSSPANNISLRAIYARKVLEKYVKLEKLKQSDSAPPTGQGWQDVPLDDFKIGLPPKDMKGPPPMPSGRVCIIGAGMAGLYVAMLLKSLGKYDFDIVEASADRVGGRVYTQSFPDQTVTHNYYDVGAMRIPDIPSMSLLFALVDLLGLSNEKVPYTYIAGNEPSMYNFAATTPPDLDAAYSAFQNLVNPIVPPTSGAITPTQLDDAWQTLMGWDLNSTREWLQQLPPNTITGEQPVGIPMSWADTVRAETMDTSTGLFDQAFTETILDYADFVVAEKNQWYRMEGGMQIIPNAMQTAIETPSGDYPGVPVQLGKRVTALAYQNGQMQVTIDDGSGNPSQTPYDTVFNTTTMGCLYQMDLSGLGLSEDMYTAIRSLSYDRSCKVAIVFTKPWWTSLITDGGTSSTDMPIRTVVYPSWDDGSGHAVLIASYTWAQDASRMGSLISNDPNPVVNVSDPLIQLVLDNLSKLWSNTQGGPTVQELESMYVEHHAHAWSHDPITGGGAFALFGPGQFSQAYPQFQQGACDNHFFMCGEAVSANHAWIAGALESATTAMQTWLLSRDKEVAMAVLKASPWGGAPGRVPDEMSEKVLQEKVKLSRRDGEKDAQHGP